MHIIIWELGNGISLGQEAQSLLDFSYYLLLLNLFLDFDLRLKVVAPFQGLNYIYKLLYQHQLLINSNWLILVRHEHISLISWNNNIVWVIVRPAVAVNLFMALHHLTVELGCPSGIPFNVKQHKKSRLDFFIDYFLVLFLQSQESTHWFEEESWMEVLGNNLEKC